MILGLDVGRQVIKTVTVEKQRSGGYKLLHVAQRLIPEQHKAYDPEAVSRPIVVMAIKEILKQQKNKSETCAKSCKQYQRHQCQCSSNHDNGYGDGRIAISAHF